MFNEEIRQAILNGAYAVSRSGMKCKFIGHSLNTDDYTHTFIYLNENGLIYSMMKLNSNFKNYDSIDSDFDVIGLWQDKAEPFNLNKALAGEPVMVRSGNKAYIKYQLPEEYNGGFPLGGYIIDLKNELATCHYSWSLTGKAVEIECNHPQDIIGMWKEHQLESKTVTVTLPCPLTEPQDEMWFIRLDGYVKSSYDKTMPTHFFKNRLYFGSEEEAKTWYNTIQNSRK